MNKSEVIIRSVIEKSVFDIVKEMFDRFDYKAFIPEGSKVVIKVNLSTPFKENAEASNTSPEILEAVCRIVKDRTDRVIVGESNGMRYDTEDAFEVSGYYPILEKYGISSMNFTKDEWIETGEKLIKGWGLPKTLLEADVFISLPVLKTHATTVFTGTLKNQFGCYPQHNRILLHPRLDKVLVLINKIVKPKLAIMDAIIAMEGRGPINGRPKRLDLLLASRDPVALDATAMRLVGIDPYTSRHVVISAQDGVGNIAEGDIEINGDFEKFKTIIEPAEKDLPIKMLALISRSKFLTEKLILNPESFYPLRKSAMMWRDARDLVLKTLRFKRT
ncbi:MAG: DUF362 domain-containing protein [Candidatus Latescibacteria bacterium]|nr:DUF362 domain-containing protein [Candidatus Latescibacterota bacterium]NIM21494.1 DUF362 domain-containing protein [Candidatus Latescibacterota bacterium]NIM65665.1 DUF362 domain-containing protein [Candidatus Latescibacterota bacterium]NIO02047.1 DUF362 domain-containing protein [Candidatus Latescibacterota bacterium]NIO28859.1 DUF362 domain-containing protein [Candidatus Latescibacterota bacterium]